MTHWMTSTLTKTLSAQRSASSFQMNTISTLKRQLAVVEQQTCEMAVPSGPKCVQTDPVSPSQCGTEVSRFLVLSLLQKFLCVSDLARKDKRVLSKKYQIYFW